MDARKNALYWKLYAWTLGTLIFWNYMAATPFESYWYYLDFAISMMGFSGLVMFAYQRRFLMSWVWKAWAFLMVGWDIYVNFFSKAFAVDTISWQERAVTALIFLLLLVPEYIGLFLYGFSSEWLWTSREDEGQRKDK